MEFQLITRRGAAALVEWHDALGVHRSTIPAILLPSVGTDLPYDVLMTGIPYGVAWEALDLGPSVPARIAQELRARGIWTRDDLQRNIAQARAAVAAVYAQDVTTLIDGARRASGGNNQ